jgi:hypothetical protein
MNEKKTLSHGPAHLGTTDMQATAEMAWNLFAFAMLD